MGIDLIHDRGRGPEINGTRITVQNLLPHLLDPATTEADIVRLYDLTPEQVAAARAFILNHPEAVLAEPLEIEGRMSAGNPPEVIEQAKRTHETFQQFKRWLDERQATRSQGSDAQAPPTLPDRFPPFQEWLAEHESWSKQGS